MLKYLYPLSVHYCFTVTKIILIQTSESISSKSTTSSKKLKKEKKGRTFNNFCLRKEVFIRDGGRCL